MSVFFLQLTVHVFCVHTNECKVIYFYNTVLGTDHLWSVECRLEGEGGTEQDTAQAGKGSEFKKDTNHFFNIYFTVRSP